MAGTKRLVVGLARVSTTRAEQDVSIDAQVEQLKQAGCDRVFAERASGYRAGVRRPAWDELRALVAAGHVGEVVAVSQSRLSRSGEDLVFLRMCHRLGVQVRFLDGTSGDIGDPAGRLLAGVMSTVNEVDSLIKSLNTKNGLNRRKAAGYYACGKVPFGYVLADGKVMPHRDDFSRARELWELLRATEFNLPRSIKEHGLDWSVRGLGLWLRNPILLGVVRGVPEATEALISRGELAEALAMIEQRRTRNTRAPRVIRLFSGMVRCQSCGGRLHYRKSFGKQRLGCGNLSCRWHGRGLAEWKIRNQVVAALRGCRGPLSEAVRRQEAIQPAAGSGTGGTGPAQAIHQQLERLLELQACGVPALEGSIAALEDQLAALDSLPAGPDWTGLEELLRRPGVLEGASDEELRAVVLEFVDEVVYLGDANRVEVRLRRSAGGDPQQGVT